MPAKRLCFIVIGIIAAILLVSYNGVTGNAKLTAVKSVLTDANSALGAKSALAGGLYRPNAFPDNIDTKDGIILELTVPTSESENGYCVNAYSDATNSIWSYHFKDGLTEKVCPFAVSVDSLGGDIPNAPTGINLAADFNQWKMESGNTTVINYDDSAKELVLLSNSGVSSMWRSPPIRVTGATNLLITVETMATVAAATNTPNGGANSTHTNDNTRYRNYSLILEK